MFHWLFLYVPEGSRFAFRLRVCADIDQRGARLEPTAVVSFRSGDPLALCLSELGVTGYSHWLDETQGGVPKFSYHECTPDQIVASLESQPLPRVAHVTLIAPDTPIAEMKRRIASLREKVGRCLEIEEPA